MLRHAIPLSVVAYERMGGLGLVDGKTELLRGVIFEKMSKSPLRSALQSNTDTVPISRLQVLAAVESL